MPWPTGDNRAAEPVDEAWGASFTTTNQLCLLAPPGPAGWSARTGKVAGRDHSATVVAPVTSSLARRLWEGVEPIHCVVYFTPEAVEAYRDVGLKGYWMGYFGSRAAALGPVSAPVVQAIFYNFGPRMVSRSIPDAWRFATPETILAARHRGVDAALQRLLRDADAGVVEEAGALAQRLCTALPVEGRTLFAAHAALPWPESAHMRLWHAATLLREHRADGHFAALLAEGVDGCEALVLQVGAGRVARENLEPHRGWTGEEWVGAQERLRSRGLLDDAGGVTEAGAALRTHVEQVTDQLALPRPSALGHEEMSRLVALVHSIRGLLDAAGVVPYPNPMGLERL
jgi:hypothetical protein